MGLSIKENFALQPYNTFGVQASARYYVEINQEEELPALYAQYEAITQGPVLVLGGGSNILLTKDFDGLVIRINIKGISHSVAGTAVTIVAGGGEVWNDLVWYAVNRDFAGLENMALIPGTVGAAPIQNIGAYGVELKDVFLGCRAFDTKRREYSTFDKEACRFAYRDSIFKNEAKGRFIITQVTFGLSLTPTLNTAYGAINTELAKRNISNPTIRDIAEVVSTIRTEKLPNPSTIGNSGSFFKNPIISVQFLKHLQSTLPDMDFVYFPVDDRHVKLAAGWLIEQCGWKGKRIGDAGTWKNQALVLVNHKNATGSAIYNLSTRIIGDVEAKFGITLEREVTLL